jgi:hypothetical protein
MAVGKLRHDMSKALFETWVEPLRPLSFQEGLFTIATVNPYGRDWVESRIKNSLVRLLAGIYGTPVALEVVLASSAVTAGPAQRQAPSLAGDAPVAPPDEPAFAPPDEPPDSAEPAGRNGPSGSRRKVMLQRAYGSRRASVVQPERGMFLTMYFFNNWLPLLGHSAFTVILAARSLCFWNPLTGELRNTIDTEMAELAQRAAVSVRTVKDVLAMDLVQRFFLRYRVRRMMTSNGVRTAGITLLVRMDDPLTPEDQAAHNLPEDEHWFPVEFDPEEES